jgi:LmbE family N-acetylglucosaminyl deacetylase
VPKTEQKKGKLLMEDKTNNQKIVMTITAHPDDSEFGAGGTIAKWVREGQKVICVVCTNGDKGSSAEGMTSQKLAVIREAEQKAAAAVLGVSEVIFLGYPDGGLEDTAEFRAKLVRLLRKYRPDAVITHDPKLRYMGHRDHRIAGLVAMDAIFPYSRDALFYPEHQAEGLLGHKVKEVYFTGAEDPDVFIDISETFEIKARAIRCHVSQVGARSPEDWERWMKAMAQRSAAMQKRQGLPLAEGFKKIEPRQ